MTSTTFGNQQKIRVARDEARERIQAELKSACRAVARVGVEALGEALDLPVENYSIKVGDDMCLGTAAASTFVRKPKDPADADRLMVEVRAFVRRVEDTVAVMMAADDARTAEMIRQWEASAR